MGVEARSSNSQKVVVQIGDKSVHGYLETPALADCGRNGTMAKIAQAEELLQQLGSISFQGSENIRHVGSYLRVSLRTDYATNKRNTTSLPL